MRVETVYKMRTHMKRISAAALALFCATSFGATLNPVQLLNPAGSTAGQAILSTGATTPPAWTTITPAIIGGLQASNNLSDVASATAALTNLGGLSTTAAASTYATITNLNLKAPLASPTFTGTVTATGATLAGFTGRLLNVRVFSTSGTYTSTSGTSAVYVKVQAGGGAGGGSGVTSTAQASVGAGGVAGAYAEGYYTSGFSGVTVTVGAAGVSASGANGGAGGTSSFGALLSCPGGTGGNVGSVTGTAPFVTAAGSATAACTGTSLFANLGLPGGQGVVVALTATKAGDGMGTIFGGATLGPWSAAPGLSAKAPGASGPGANAQASTAAQAGGTGGAGIVEIFEFSQ